MMNLNFTEYSAKGKELAINILESYGLSYTVESNIKKGIYRFTIEFPDNYTMDKVLNELWETLEFPTDVLEALDNMVDDAYKYDA